MSNSTKPDNNSRLDGSRLRRYDPHPDFKGMRNEPGFRSVMLNRNIQTAQIGPPPEPSTILPPPNYHRKGGKKVHPEDSSPASKKDVEIPLCWKVASLHPPLENYAVSRTSRFIEGTEARVICDRIVKVLKKLLIMTEYDSDQAVVRCETECCAKFDICLYCGRGEFSKGIIVEAKKKKIEVAA